MRTEYIATNLYADYEDTFGDAHYFKGMVGYGTRRCVCPSSVLRNVKSPRTCNLFSRKEAVKPVVFFNTLATNLYADYEDTFGDAHYFKGMVGYNYEQSTYKSTDSDP